MASKIYPKFKEAILTDAANIDLADDTIKAFPVSADDYTYSDADQFLDDVTTYSGVSGVTLTNVTVSGNVVDCDDFKFEAVANDNGKDIDAVVIVRDTGSAATSHLIAYIEHSPVTPNGGDIEYTVDNGANKLFAL